MTEGQEGTLPVEAPAQTPVKKAAKKKAAKKRALIPAARAPQQVLEDGSEILFNVKRLHGYHGTVLDVDAPGGVLCRVNEEALEGNLVIFPADQLVLANPGDIKKHHSDRLGWNYKD